MLLGVPKGRPCICLVASERGHASAGERASCDTWGSAGTPPPPLLLLLLLQKTVVVPLLPHCLPTTPPWLPSAPPPAGSFKDYAKGRGRAYHCPSCSEVKRHRIQQTDAQQQQQAAVLQAALLQVAGNQAEVAAGAPAPVEL